MNIKDSEKNNFGKLFVIIVTLLVVGVPLGIWKLVSMHAYNSKQEVVDTFVDGTVEHDNYSYIRVKDWHYMTGAETGISTGYGGHSIAFITVGAGIGENQGKFYIGIFSVDQRIFYGDKSVLSRGVNCEDATEISAQELEGLIVKGRQALVLQRVITRTFCQMSGSLEEDTDVSGSIRNGARLAYHDQ